MRGARENDDNLDVLGGNSGAPVFLLSTHNVVGMHVVGVDGYNDIGECKILQECPTELNCKGEGVLLSKFLPTVK